MSRPPSGFHSLRANTRRAVPVLLVALLGLTQGACRTPGQCQLDTECEASKFCVSGTCRYRCNSTDVCPSAMVCSGGACVPPEDVAPGFDAGAARDASNPYASSSSTSTSASSMSGGSSSGGVRDAGVASPVDGGCLHNSCGVCGPLPVGFGEACSSVCGAGANDCDGVCNAPPAPLAYGQACTTACGVGTVTCTGGCLVAGVDAGTCSNACHSGPKDCTGACLAPPPPTGFGVDCSNSCGAGRYDCSGRCTAPVPPATLNTPCGCLNSGRVQCDGTCSVGPGVPSVGAACGNACFQGVVQCDGQCSAAPEPAAHGLVCTLAPCAHAGTVACDGSCDAAPCTGECSGNPPPNYLQPCSNACNNGVIQCDGQCSAAPCAGGCAAAPGTTDTAGCVYDVPATPSGGTASVNNGAAGYTGVLAGTCSQGAWINVTDSCAPAGCAAGPGTLDGNGCVYDIPATAHGGTVSVTNTAAPYTGVLAGTCDHGVWLNVTNSCAPAPCTSAPGLPDGAGCVFDVPATPHGGTASVNNNAAGYSGVLAGTCDHGVWLNVTDTCAPLGCAGAVGFADGLGCVYDVPTTAHGGSVSVGNHAGSYTGVLSGTCDHGNWVGVSDSCAPN